MTQVNCNAQGRVAPEDGGMDYCGFAVSPSNETFYLTKKRIFVFRMTTDHLGNVPCWAFVSWRSCGELFLDQLQNSGGGFYNMVHCTSTNLCPKCKEMK